MATLKEIVHWLFEPKIPPEDQLKQIFRPENYLPTCPTVASSLEGALWYMREFSLSQKLGLRLEEATIFTSFLADKIHEDDWREEEKKWQRKEPRLQSEYESSFSSYKIGQKFLEKISRREISIFCTSSGLEEDSEEVQRFISLLHRLANNCWANLTYTAYRDSKEQKQDRQVFLHQANKEIEQARPMAS